MKPNLFIIGQQKAGTSALYESLIGNPEIFIPETKKEFHYLAIDELKKIPKEKLEKKGVVASEAEYLSYFKEGKTRYAADFSTSYIYYPKSFVKKISEINCKDPKVIIVLRDDKERTISAYKHLFKYGEEYARECLKKSINNETTDLTWDEDIIGYTKKTNSSIKTIEDATGVDNVLKINYSEFRNTPEAALKKIEEFLSIHIEKKATNEKNSSTYIKNKILNRLIYEQSAARDKIRKLLPPSIIKLLSKTKDIIIRKASSNPEISGIEKSSIERALRREHQTQ